MSTNAVKIWIAFWRRDNSVGDVNDATMALIKSLK